jgi:site-specific DNA recombinase
VWNDAHARLHAISTQLKAKGQHCRRRRDIDSKYLLSGFARCATCGGTLSVLSRSSGSRRLYSYGCLAHAKRGKTVCDNALVLPIDRVDDAVLTELRQNVPRPAVVRAIIQGVFEALRPQAITTNVTALRSDLRTLDQKIAHLTAAVENGDALAPIVARLRARQVEREALLSSIASAEAIGQLQVDRRVVEEKVLRQVENWRELLTSNGRQGLRAALDGPIEFVPEGRKYHFRGKTAAGALIAALVGQDSM